MAISASDHLAWPHGRVSLVLLSVVVWLSPGAPALTVVAKAESGSSPTAPRLRVWVYFLNEDTVPVAARFPTALACRVYVGAKRIAAVARCDEREPATGLAQIQPGTFQRCRYWVELPETASGPVIVDVLPANEQSPASAASVTSQASIGPGSTAAGVPAVARVAAAAVPSTATAAALAVPPLSTAAAGTSGVTEAPSSGSEPGAGGPATLRLAFPGLGRQISTHEPIYFLYGAKHPNARYQISLKYRLLHPEGPLAESSPWLSGLHAAYTQTSLWDLDAPSEPFYDSSYRPELFTQREDLGLRLPGVSRLDLRVGLQHESNGKDGSASRSLNLAYLRPTAWIANRAGLQLAIEPRVWVYVGRTSDNPDIGEYRGYGDLTLRVGWPDGLQLAIRAGVGSGLEHALAQLDLTYPAQSLLPWVAPGVYLHAQYLVGYGESLLDYRDQTQSLRLGLSVAR